MSDFLRGFSRALIEQLERDGKVELAEGASVRVVHYLAHHLASLGEGRSLLSSVEQALLACDDVVELYFDLEELKAVVEDLR